MGQSLWPDYITRDLQEGGTRQRYAGELWKFASGPTTTIRPLVDRVNKLPPGCRLSDDDNAFVAGFGLWKQSPLGARPAAAARKPARPAKKCARSQRRDRSIA